MSKLSTVLGRTLFWLAWPLLFFYFRLGARTRVLVMCDSEVLVVRSRFGNGKWGLPGGGLHRHELPVNGVLRELQEETSITLQPAQLKPLLSEIYRNIGFRFLCHYFFVELKTKPSTTRQRLEVAELAWLPPRDLTKATANLDVLTACAAFFGK